MATIDEQSQDSRGDTKHNLPGAVKLCTDSVVYESLPGATRSIQKKKLSLQGLDGGDDLIVC